MAKDAGPHQNQDPASGAEQDPDQQHNPIRRTTENLPPPFFILLFLLLAFYFLFSPSLSSPEPSVVPEYNSLLTSTPTSSIIPDSPSNNFTMSSTEQTFIAIKPDGVQRGLVGPIISRFENRGFKLAAIKLISPGKEHLETHYADLSDKPFFAGLIQYMSSGPICAMVWEGRDAVKTGRSILGATNPLASAPGTIRGDFAIDVGRNVCHGSDSVENAKKEIALWFKDGEVLSWKSSQFDWVYEKA
ncbi:nucleoside diphosphate kinase [Dactylonectria estremocensis]|uniref:Nucleoside diphosphate kinase n=1 Tax=Dactylonectria estremocensis TaxID=1079267 RepID=A0A9P9F059_9HYPO|nr:nucleoside diphosphate kinase [Dactylonectria estremocensis]